MRNVLRKSWRLVMHVQLNEKLRCEICWAGNSSGHGERKARERESNMKHGRKDTYDMTENNANRNL